MPILSIAPPEVSQDTSTAPSLAQPPVRGHGFASVMVGLGRYLIQTEVHTYAFSVAACAILSFFPLIVMMYTLARYVLHSEALWRVIGDLVRVFLPTTRVDQDFVVRNITTVVSGQHHVQLISIVTLLISCTGIFLPLEVALNQVWGVKKCRSYLMNQVIAFGLAMMMALLAMGAVSLNSVQRSFLYLVFFGHTENAFYRMVSVSLLEITTVLAIIAMFFFTYWLLPNRKIPALAVLPTAILTGLIWWSAKLAYTAVLPRLDLKAAYGPFYLSVGLIMWGYVSGLLLLGGAHYSATRHTLRLARQADKDATADA